MDELLAPLTLMALVAAPGVLAFHCMRKPSDGLLWLLIPVLALAYARFFQSANVGKPGGVAVLLFPASAR